MNVLIESAELQELLQAMDIVIGATPVAPQAAEQATTTAEEIHPILDRIERREKQGKYSGSWKPTLQPNKALAA
jgi:hypothetical protein